MRVWFMVVRRFFFPNTSRMFSFMSGHLRVWCSIFTLKMFTGEINHWEMKIIYKNDSEFGDQVTEITQTGTMHLWNREGYKILCFNSLNPSTTLLSTSLSPAKNYFVNLVYHMTRNFVICIGHPVLKIWWNIGGLLWVRYIPWIGKTWHVDRILVGKPFYK